MLRVLLPRIFQAWVFLFLISQGVLGEVEDVLEQLEIQENGPEKEALRNLIETLIETASLRNETDSPSNNARNQRARVMSHLFRRTEDKHGVEEPPENAHYGLPSDVLTPSDPDFLVRQRATSVPSIFKRYGSMSSLFKRVVPPRLYPSLAALFKRRLMTSLFKRNSLVYPEESPVLEP